LVRALLAFLVILSLGWPLSRLTRGTAPTRTPAVAAPVLEKKEVRLQLAFPLVPKTVKVLHLGEIVWSESSPTAEMERAIAISYPAEGVDLHFQIEWPADTGLAAMRVRLIDPAGDTHEKSVWGKGAVDEVVTFP
jgi:hypothetical protein